MLNLESSGSSVQPGANFTVNVVVDNVDPFDPLIAFGFDVVIDPGVTFSSAVVAPQFFDDSGFFPSTDVAGSTLSSPSGDDILLATLSFTADQSPGLFLIGIQNDTFDFGLTEGLFTATQLFEVSMATTVEVLAPSIPEPSSLALLAIGLVGFRIVCSRRRHVRQLSQTLRIDC